MRLAGTSCVRCGGNVLCWGFDDELCCILCGRSPTPAPTLDDIPAFDLPPHRRTVRKDRGVRRVPTGVEVSEMAASLARLRAL